MSQLTQWPLPIQEDLGLNPGIGNFFATYSQFAGSGFESYFRYTERSINITTKISFPLRQSNLTRANISQALKLRITALSLSTWTNLIWSTWGIPNSQIGQGLKNSKSAFELKTSKKREEKRDDDDHLPIMLQRNIKIAIFLSLSAVHKSLFLYLSLWLSLHVHKSLSLSLIVSFC